MTHFCIFLIIEFFLQNLCYFIDVELRRLHRCFEHFSIRRFQQMLARSRHEMKTKTLQHLIKYCQQCQKHDASFERFSFTIKNNVEFNYNVIVDIMYIQDKSILHLIDEVIRFQTKR